MPRKLSVMFLTLLVCAVVIGCASKQQPQSNTPAVTPSSNFRETGIANNLATMGARTTQTVGAPTQTPTPSVTPTSTLEFSPTPTLTPFPTLQPILSDDQTIPTSVARIPPITLPAEFSESDGKYYLFRDRFGLQVIDTATRNVLWIMRFGSEVYPNESPDERWVFANIEGAIYVWDIQTGELHSTYDDNRGGAEILSWSPSGNILLMQNDRFPRGLMMILWNPLTSETLYTIQDQKIEIGDALWTKDGRYLITSNYAHGQSDNEIVVRDASTGQRIREMLADAYTYHGISIANLHLNPRETILAATYGHSGGDAEFVPGLTILWDIETGEQLQKLESPDMWDSRFSPDGTRIAPSIDFYYDTDQFEGIPIWDTKTGQEVLRLDPPFELLQFQSLTSLEWSPNGSLISTVIGGRVDLWNGLNGQYLRTLEGNAGTITWSEDGTSVRSATREWNLVTGEIIELRSSSSGSVVDLTWLPNGKGVVIAGDHIMQVWNLSAPASSSPELQFQIDFWDIDPSSGGVEAYLSNISAVAVSPNSQVIAVATGANFRSGFGGLTLWDVTSGKQIRIIDIRGEDETYTDVAWSPDGRYIATSGNKIKVWDAETNQLVKEFEAESSIGISWSPDGSQIAAAGYGYVGVWNFESGEQLTNLATQLDARYYNSDEREVANTVTWTSDGRYLAAGTGGYVFAQGAILVWDAQTFERYGVFYDQPEPVTGLSWLQGGKIIAASGGHSPIEEGAHMFSSGSYTGSLILWDTETGKPLQFLYGHTAEVQAVSLSPDGKYLASGSADGTVYIWDVSGY